MKHRPTTTCSPNPAPGGHDFRAHCPPASAEPGRSRQRPAHRGRDVPIGRALFLVDLENLLCDPHDVGGAAEALARCLVAGGWRPGDHLKVAGHPSLVLAALRALAGLGCRALPAHGPNGADLRLLTESDPAFMAARYRRVVIASGDGIFTDVAAELGRRGIPVWVVAPQGSLAARLRLAAARVVVLAPVSTPSGRLPEPASAGLRARQRSSPRGSGRSPGLVGSYEHE